ncbi:MAG: methyltransferase domain-containing protein, partial [Firmicutes bacterium]|nr:methyltransferase domain-containing protein [Bacillota bacterium]
MSGSAHFDQAAATWDDSPRRVELARAVAEGILQRIPLDTRWSLLDFGCGTGLLGLALRPKVGRLTGADPSPEMLKVLARKAEALGFPDVALHRLDPEAALEGMGTFHLLASTMTLHHVADLPPLFRQFHGHLEPGGWIALADLDREDGSFHEDATGVFHRGFDRIELLAHLAEAGFEELRVETIAPTTKNGRNYSIFLLTG